MRDLRLPLLLCFIALYALQWHQPRAGNTSRTPARFPRTHADDGTCAPDYEACGAVPAPVGSTPCCSPDFFCYRQAPYFSQCRPICAALSARCTPSRPCCAGAVCAPNATCARAPPPAPAASAAWFAWRMQSRNRARELVVALDAALAGVGHARIAALHVDVAMRRANAADRITKAVPDVAVMADPFDPRALVVRPLISWDRTQARDVGIALAAFPMVVDIRVELAGDMGTVKERWQRTRAT